MTGSAGFADLIDTFLVCARKALAAMALAADIAPILPSDDLDATAFGAVSGAIIATIGTGVAALAALATTGFLAGLAAACAGTAFKADLGDTFVAATFVGAAFFGAGLATAFAGAFEAALPVAFAAITAGAAALTIFAADCAAFLDFTGAFAGAAFFVTFIAVPFAGVFAVGLATAFTGAPFAVLRAGAAVAISAARITIVIGSSLLTWENS